MKHQEAKQQKQGGDYALSSFISGDWKDNLDGACHCSLSRDAQSLKVACVAVRGRSLRQSLRGGNRPCMELRAPQPSPSLQLSESQVWPHSALPFWFSLVALD